MTPVRLSAAFAAVALWCCAFLASASAADTVGQVIRAQGTVLAVSQGEERALAPGSIVARDDTLETRGAGSRLEIRLIDGAQLALGENASLRVDDLVFNASDASRSRLSLFVLGAFRMVTGQINAAVGGEVQVSAPAASMVIRGTDFWAGPSDGVFGVLLLDGNVEVRTAGGAVTLDAPGEGTSVADANLPPAAVSNWAPDRVQRALAQVAFTQ
jgi:hypothetical protein